MKKLEIELFRYDTLVFGRVIYQDESLRHKGPIVEKDGFSIESKSYIDLQKETLFINGDYKQNDNRIFCYRFCNVETAIKSCEKIKASVDLINKAEKNQPFLEKII